jgi:protease II
MSLRGDTNPWRDIGHAKWFDPFAALEDTESEEFLSAVKEELNLWSAAKKPTEAWRKDIENYKISVEPAFAHETMLWQGLTIRIQHAPGHRKNIWFLDVSQTIVRTHIGLTDFGVDNDSELYFTIRDIGDGAERLALEVWNIRTEESCWTFKHVVGPNAGFLGNHILYQNVENHLRYPAILWAEKYTGKHEEVLYTNSEKRFQIDLIMTDKPYICAHNALDQRIGRVVGTSGIEWITPLLHETLIPISTTIYGKERAIVQNRRNYPLPHGEHIVAAREFGDSVFVTTVKSGFTSLYRFQDAQFTRLFAPHEPNEIMIHGYSTHPSVSITSPSKPTIVYQIVEDRLLPIFQFPSMLEIPYTSFGVAKSKDGTAVPYTYVSTTLRPKKLIVEAYGSYGISSRRSYPIRWLPWLTRGYAYAVAMPRGGRDNGDPWYEGGRTLRKQNTFDDTAAVLKSVQRRFRISPKKTIFYGRSAGGFLAANIAQQYPHLVAAIYAEVPYVDVLRTTSNPDLPLTQMEYDEFGDPIGKIEDYVSLQQISPVDTVPVAPNNAPLCLIRTGINDAQVLPYEAVKWAKKLRAMGWTALLGIDMGGGHFAAENVIEQQYAEDAAILDHFVGSRRVSKTRKLRSHVTKGTRRRRTNSLKH